MAINGSACIVTGAGRGIGQAIAARLCRGGARVVAAARSAGELEDTVSLSGGIGSCVAHAVDLTRPQASEELVARCLKDFGRLDLLVNNAGVAPLGRIEELDEASFDELIAVNVNAVFRACRAAWPALKASKGVIVNISSMAAVDPFPGFAAYGATKAWVNTFTRGLADEGRPLGIRVFGVAPGAVETSLMRARFPDFPADQALRPDDVAAMVEMLLDERCRPATGQTIYIRK